MTDSRDKLKQIIKNIQNLDNKNLSVYYEAAKEVNPRGISRLECHTPLNDPVEEESKDDVELEELENLDENDTLVTSVKK